LVGFSVFLIFSLWTMAVWKGIPYHPNGHVSPFSATPTGATSMFHWNMKYQWKSHPPKVKHWFTIGLLFIWVPILGVLNLDGIRKIMENLFPGLDSTSSMIFSVLGQDVITLPVDNP
jgi:hypothetical protein